MKSIDFNNDPLELPGSKLNPARYKLPPALINYSFDFPTIEQADYLSLPTSGYLEDLVLPGGSLEDELELGTIPRPYVQTVRYIHEGISPRFTEGFLILDGSGFDIHHIVKKSYVIADPHVARDLLPFNGAVKATFDMLAFPQTPDEAYNKKKVGGRGHMLINLIPLDYSFHHNFIEQRDYNHRVNIRMGRDELWPVTIPELLMSFTVFNLNYRLQMLTYYIQQGIENCIAEMESTSDNRIKLTKQYHLFAWQQMQAELLRIPVVAEEIKAEHSYLYRIWQKTMNLAGFINRVPVFEQ